MHPLLQPLFYYLWVAPHLLLGVVLLLMIRRKLYKQYSVFLFYTVFEFLQFMVLFAVGRSGSFSAEQYRIMFSVGSAASAVLRFGIIYEIFIGMFRDYPGLNELGRTLLRWATVGLVLVGVALAAVTHGNGTYSPVVVLSVLDRTVSILQCGLLMFLFVFSRYFALSWRNYAFGLALGFGVFASVELATSAIRSQIGSTSADVMDLVVMAAYHCCVLIWVFYLAVPEQTGYRGPKKLPPGDLEVWNQELQRLLQS